VIEWESVERSGDHHQADGFSGNGRGCCPLLGVGRVAPLGRKSCRRAAGAGLLVLLFLIGGGITRHGRPADCHNYRCLFGVPGMAKTVKHDIIALLGQ
jgi:hypothetical protein